MWQCSSYLFFNNTQSSTKSIPSLYFGDYFTQHVIFLLDLSAAYIMRVIISSNLSKSRVKCVGSG